MKKKTLGRITALGLAALTAVPAFSIVASAEFTLPNAWRVQTGVDNLNNPLYDYYTDKDKADSANSFLVNGSPVQPVSVTSIPGISAGATIYYDSDGKIYSTTGAGRSPVTWRGSTSGSSTIVGGGRIDTAPSTSYYYADDYYYKVKNGASYNTYYPNLTLLKYVEGDVEYERFPITGAKYSTLTPYFDYTQGGYTSYHNPGYTIPIYGTAANGATSNYYSSTYRYYSSYTGLFYTSSEAALLASNGSVSYVTDFYVNSSSVRTSSYPYYSSYTKRYYATRESAIIASGDNSAYVDGTGAYTVYYSSYTGKYYDSLSAANAATPSGYTVRTITNSAYTASYLNTYGYNYSYYNGYYNGYGYYDPNYYYYYYLSGNGFTNTTATQDTSTVTIGKYTGWTNVIKVINAARVGVSYAVNMKSETEIPENVLTAMKGKNINILFTYSNGSVITINGNDITSTTAFSPTVKYGSTSIPSTLKSKAVKSNSGVSSSQFTINGGTFGAEISVTVKFNSKRAGCSAKLYRYNASANTLSLVSRSAVQSNGQCKFDDVKQGGEYIVVLS